MVHRRERKPTATAFALANVRKRGWTSRNDRSGNDPCHLRSGAEGRSPRTAPTTGRTQWARK